MKRSEALAVLKKAINKYCSIPWNSINDDDGAISKILLQLEKAGMKPPSYQLKQKKGRYSAAVATTRIDGEWKFQLLKKETIKLIRKTYEYERLCDL